MKKNNLIKYSSNSKQNSIINTISNLLKNICDQSSKKLIENENENNSFNFNKKFF